MGSTTLQTWKAKKIELDVPSESFEACDVSVLARHHSFFFGIDWHPGFDISWGHETEKSRKINVDDPFDYQTDSFIPT